MNIIIIILIFFILICYGTYWILKNNELDFKSQKLVELQEKLNSLQKEIQEQNSLIIEKKDVIKDLDEEYNLKYERNNSDLINYFYSLKEQREKNFLEESNKIWEEKSSELQNKYQLLLLEYQQKEEAAKVKMQKTIEESGEKIAEALNRTNEINSLLESKELMFDALLEPIKQYEKEKQEKIYYTIQVPEEYKKDIDFLLRTVSLKIQHPDIINKLIWSEYVKPYLDQAFKRIEIKEEPGIYKITNINDNKCYIGKSVNVKKRLTDHFKASVGLSSISHQEVHDAIYREGYWNWMIEIIIYTEKEKLNDLEKYYINFFHSDTFGYNKTKGGEG